MNILETLPEEILLMITTYLNFQKREIFKGRLINKAYKKIIDMPITIYGYPDLNKMSFFFLSLEYHSYLEEKRLLRIEADRNFRRFHQTMLLDYGWI